MITRLGDEDAAKINIFFPPINYLKKKLPADLRPAMVASVPPVATDPGGPKRPAICVSALRESGFLGMWCRLHFRP
jgi:hypothetical protein